MQPKSKKDYFKIIYLILLQNLFCINRTQCLERKNHKILGNVLFYLSVTIIIGINMFEIISFIIHTRINTLPVNIIYGHCIQFILLIELIALAILAKKQENTHEKLHVLEDKCGKIPYFIRNRQIKEDASNSRRIIVLSVVSAIIDMSALTLLEYSAGTVISLTIAFAAHDTELLFLSIVMMEFNDKITILIDMSAEMGIKLYRHLMIAAPNFTEDYKFAICVSLIMTLTTTVIYIGTAIMIDGPRTQKVLCYLIWRELRSFISLWLLCSASFQTRIRCDSLLKRLTERLVFELDSKEKSAREWTKRWLKCIKLIPIQYFDSTCFTVDLALPLALLDYCSNYFLIIVQMYPIVYGQK